MKETYIIGTPHHEDSIIAVSYHKRRPGDASAGTATFIYLNRLIIVNLFIIWFYNIVLIIKINQLFSSNFELIDVNTYSEGPKTYEEAITATGFGKFNIILLLTTIPSALASICATSALSLILSEAQCDLNLTLEDKGMLNAITYIGMQIFA